MLFDAIKAGDAAAVTSLLDSDPSLLQTTQNNVTPILFALYHGKADIARLLAQRNAELSFAEACALGERARVEAMLENDPHLLNSRSADGYPAFGLAIFFGQPDTARLLIERGADVNAHAENAQRVAPLHAAAAVCNHELIRLLLARGADPNARQQNDFTPLHTAGARGDRAMAELLLQHGADPNAKTTDGKTPADVARGYGHAPFAEWLEGVT